MDTEPLTEDPGDEGDDQAVSAGSEVKFVEEDDLNDAPEDNELEPEPDPEELNT